MKKLQILFTICTILFFPFQNVLAVNTINITSSWNLDSYEEGKKLTLFLDLKGSLLTHNKLYLKAKVRNHDKFTIKSNDNNYVFTNHTISGVLPLFEKIFLSLKNPDGKSIKFKNFISSNTEWRDFDEVNLVSDEYGNYKAMISIYFHRDLDNQAYTTLITEDGNLNIDSGVYGFIGIEDGKISQISKYLSF